MNSGSQEVITCPSISGEISLNKLHCGYVGALQGKLGWGEGDYIN